MKIVPSRKVLTVLLAGLLAAGVTVPLVVPKAWSAVFSKANRMSAEDVQAIVTQSSGGKAKVEKLLPARADGMTGAIVTSDGQRFVGWVPRNTKVILVGALFDDKGDNLTAIALRDNQLLLPTQKAAQPDAFIPPPAQVNDGIIAAVEKADGIIEGNTGPMVHVFIDLNCGYCNGLYRQLKPLVNQGKLSVHWIPVAVLHETSVTLAAEVLQAKNSALKLGEHEANSDTATGRPGIKGEKPSAKTEQIIAANSQLLRVVNNGVAATPILVFRGKEGKVFQHSGLLRDASDILMASK